jgi:PAS domain S-box-containing protein
MTSPPEPLPPVALREVDDESVRHGDALFRALVEGVKDYAIYVIDPQGRVATWNEGAERIKGYTADEIIGQPFSRFYPEEDTRAGKTERELETARTQGRFEEEGWRVRKDGSRFWASVIITPLRNRNGHLIGYAKVTRDLTERRQHDLERIRVAQVEEAMRLRDEFLSIASHELKTPLSSLMLQLESMRVRLLQSCPDVVDRVDRATRAGNRLIQLVEALLDVSRLATGQVELRRTSFDLGEAAAEIVERMAEGAAQAGCAVTLRRSGPVVGAWDRMRVEQIVTNLLSNAFKYAAGTAIDVAVEAAGDTAVLTVRDHGPGIKNAELDRIFGRFERGVSMRNYGGMGLGLYVVAQIAGGHGGTARASNAVGGGAMVTVRLPLTPPVPSEESA